MSPDLFFWYGLVLKVAMTATIVVIVSVAAERSGPFIAALIAALPTAAGATYIILAFEHPPAFIAAAAIGSLAANAAVAIFALSYTALAQRHGIVLSVAVATLLWIGSFASGVFAVFPIVLATFVVIMHPRAGGKAAAAVLAHAQPVLVGLPLGFLGVHYLAGWIGVWWSLAAGLAISTAWSAVLWLVRRARLRIA